MQQVYTRDSSIRQVGCMLGTLGFSMLLLLGRAQPTDAGSCGPGSGWVDNCPPGTDAFKSKAEHGTVIFDAEDGGLVIDVPILTGPTRVVRGQGAAGHIDTEMVALRLSGGGLTLRAGDGRGNVRCDGPFCSPGGIDTLGSTLAHSFFDVFFEISPTPFGPLHNANPLGNSVDRVLGLTSDPCRMEADIDRVPPLQGTTYLCSTAPVDLYDSNGVHRAVLTGTPNHIVGDPVPEPATLLLLGSGLVGVAGVGYRRKLSQRASTN